MKSFTNIKNLWDEYINSDEYTDICYGNRTAADKVQEAAQKEFEKLHLPKSVLNNCSDAMTAISYESEAFGFVVGFAYAARLFREASEFIPEMAKGGAQA